MQDFRAEFAEQKSVAKSITAKLKSGTLIELKFIDSPNCWAVLLEKMEVRRGACMLEILLFDEEITSHAAHNQVVRVGPNVLQLIKDSIPAAAID
jgi:hypothetical protein